MTGSIVPADQWPEWADRHCWDKNGDGWFYGLAQAGEFAWWPELRRSNIPMPAGHDWRVPVMRQPAIDLEQFRAFARQVLAYIEDWAETSTEDGNIDQLGDEAERLLALIDGQPSKSETGCPECNRLGDQPCPSCQAEIDAEGSDD